VEDETDIVVLTEGIFDAISLTRKLDLYDDHSIVPIATFGKKISDTQMLKLQDKGVRTVVIGYDSDATESINKAAQMLSDYFDVFIAKIDSDGKDWDEMSYKDIYHTFAYNLMTPVEFKLQTVQV
jgi:DNA primase